MQFFLMLAVKTKIPSTTNKKKFEKDTHFRPNTEEVQLVLSRETEIFSGFIIW